MEMRHLRYFVAVVDAGSFSRAAGALDLAQPTLSRQIASLEEEIGTQLLERAPRGVALTEAGKSFVVHARAITQHAEQAAAEAAGLSRAVRGVAAIGAPHMFGQAVLGEVAQVYGRKYPDVTLRFVEGLSYLLLEWLEAGRIDLAVLTNMKLDKRYRSVRMFAEPVHALAPPGHPLLAQRTGPLKLAEVARHPLIVSTSMNQGRKILEDMARKQGIALKVAIEAEDPSTAIALVRRDLGIALRPVYSYPRDPSIESRPVEGLKLDRYLVQRRDIPQRRAVSELARILLATVQRQYGDRTGR